MFNQASRYRYIGTDLSMGLSKNVVYEINIEIWPQRMGGCITVEMRNLLGQVFWRCPYTGLAAFNRNWVKI